MTNEGLHPNPASEATTVPVEIRNIEQCVDLKKFVGHARDLDKHRDTKIHFAMGGKYKRRIEREFWDWKKELGITERRDSEKFKERMAEIEVQHDLPPYFSASEPEPLDTSGNENVIYYRLPEEEAGPPLTDP